MGAKRPGNKFHWEGTHTYRRTDGHRNSMTESAQWADSVKSDHAQESLFLDRQE